MKCKWCQKEDASFEMAIYEIKEIETYRNGITMSGKYKKTGRGDLYISIYLCGRCLPVTKIVEETVIKHEVQVRRRPVGAGNKNKV